ncbi:MAG: hypothetical protein HPY58_14220 [Firmicutes bacterium]|nr:hypothetical protein [Bacillota bacterium]
MEVLLWARLSGLHVVEVPVAWRERPGSKVRLLRDGPRMLDALWLLRREYGALSVFVPGVERA